MKNKRRIITIGFSPAWDVVCRGEVDWGMHAKLDEQVVRPAGKALNVSRALAWMGRESIAAGLWGRDDYDQMLAAVRRFSDLVEVQMSQAAGHTRMNITIADTRGGREMHLRAKSELATPESLDKLQVDLRQIVTEGDICVFSGAMPDGVLLDRVVSIVRSCHERGAKLAVDTHGEPLKALVETGWLWLISPNVGELGQLLGSGVPDTPAKLAAAGQSLLGEVEMALISRGKDGALVVTEHGTWSCRHAGRGEALTTVGCGDYLLAGFLSGIEDEHPIQAALEQAVQAATARAWDLTEEKTWEQAKSQTPVASAPLRC